MELGLRRTAIGVVLAVVRAAADLDGLLDTPIGTRPGMPLETKTVPLATEGEVAATITASCSDCSWERKAHEAAALRIEVDGRYSQHVFLTRGQETAEYAVALGRLSAGSHTVSVSLDQRRSAARIREARVDALTVRPIASDTPEEAHFAHAPILYARPDALGRFSDVPLLLWVESEAAEAGGRRLRYSVVFSNEDGGTPSDRLMATWGRLTDLEYVYGVKLDAEGRRISSEFQAPGHEIEPFAGVREAAHPVMYVVTKNNMVSDRGSKTIRFAPAPIAVDLNGVSREVVMDRSPWTYRVSAQEVRREGRVDPRAVPGRKLVPDPRRFVTLEACAATKDATITFAVGIQGDGGTRFIDSSGGLPKFRIGRKVAEFPNGCFRGSVALPAGVTASQIEALRIRAFTRLPEKGEKPLAKGSGEARLTSVNRLFALDDRDEPGPNLLEWHGEVALAPEGPAYEIRVGGKVAYR